MIGNSENPASDDSLDEAIRNAMRTEVDDEQVERLEQYWRIQSQRERWRRAARRTVAAAAAAIAIVAVGVLVWSRGGQPPEQVRKTQDSSKIIVESAPANVPKKRPKNSVQLANLPGRSPTPYEKLMFAAQAGIEKQPKPNAAAIDTLIQSIATDDAADPVKLLAASGIKHSAAEALLLRQLPHAPANQQQAILRLLTVCGSQRSVSPLLRLARDESLRPQALDTLEQIVGTGGMAEAVRNSRDVNVRSALILRLLASDSQAGLVKYLSLIGDNATRADALTVAKVAPNVPVDRLITLLDSSDQSVRVCAAITLGYINGPETTRLLIARVTEQPAHSREAWLALMQCRGEMARDFLAYATRSPQLLGYYNNARVHWSQMIQ
jgi:HEAT repeat protein